MRTPGPKGLGVFAFVRPSLTAARRYAFSMPTRDDIRPLLTSSNERLWWTWRFLDDVVRNIHGGVSDADLTIAVDCLVQLANSDPAWATERLQTMGPEKHAFGALLAYDRLERALDGVRLTSANTGAMLRATIIVTRASYLPSPADANALWARAWAELETIDVRDGAWNALALEVSAHASYADFEPLAEEKLAGMLDPFWRGSFLESAIPTAARSGDWPAFERWVSAYRALEPAFQSDHATCAILNLEGVRALDEGDVTKAVALMERILDIAPSVQFLSNDDVARLAKRLRSAGRAISLCDRFDAIVAKRDWRLLT